MRGTIISVFLIVFSVFIGALVYQVDQLMFKDKVSWSEAQARAQLSPVGLSIEQHLQHLGQTLAMSMATIKDSKHETYNSSSALGAYQMVSTLKSGGGKDWEFDRVLFPEKSKSKSWAVNYATLALKNLSAVDVKPGAFAVLSLLDPDRKTHLLIVHQMISKVESQQVKETQWLATLVGPEFFQTFIDRAKGQAGQMFIVNPLGQSLGHSTPEYVGNLLSEDPIVAEIMKAQVTSGSGVFQDLRGQEVQGSYEQVARSNLFVAITTPVSEILKARGSTQLQLGLLGLGMALVGVAVMMFVYRPEKELVMMPQQPPAGPQKVKAPSALGKPLPSDAPVTTPPPPMAPKSGGVSQEELQKEKMSAFFQVTSALGHELRLPLAKLLGHAQLLKQETPGLGHVPEIEQGARQINELVSKLLSFAGETSQGLKNTSMQKVVVKALHNMEPVFFKKGVKVIQNLDNVSEQKLNSESLVKALENIFRNSVEAMERGMKKEIHVSLSEKNRVVELKITDTGDGVDADKIGRIFEPFFSTRKGHAGLGLSMAMGIVQELNGQLLIESEKGKGTTVKIVMSPDTSSSSASASAPAVKAPPKAPPVAAEVSPPPAKAAEPVAKVEVHFKDLKIKPIGPDLVLDDKEVDQVLSEESFDGAVIEEEESEFVFEEKKLVPTLESQKLPPPPDVGLPPAAPMPLQAPSTAVGKIEKPQIKIEKKSSALDDVQVQIRKPRSPG